MSPCCAAVSPQGVLYVFGGLLDSASTSLTSPLWLYHVGEPLTLHSLTLLVWLHVGVEEKYRNALCPASIKASSPIGSLMKLLEISSSMKPPPPE